MNKDKFKPGTIVNVSCKNCGMKMVIRKNSGNDSLFLGCSEYPDCNHSEKLPESIKMEMLGAVRLL